MSRFVPFGFNLTPFWLKSDNPESGDHQFPEGMDGQHRYLRVLDYLINSNLRQHNVTIQCKASFGYNNYLMTTLRCVNNYNRFTSHISAHSSPKWNTILTFPDLCDLVARVAQGDQLARRLYIYSKILHPRGQY